MNRTLNFEDRCQWIDNDESLYHWWKNSGLNKKKFIQENKAELDRIILQALNRPPKN